MGAALFRRMLDFLMKLVGQIDRHLDHGETTIVDEVRLVSRLLWGRKGPRKTATEAQIKLEPPHAEGRPRDFGPHKNRRSLKTASASQPNRPPRL